MMPHSCARRSRCGPTHPHTHTPSPTYTLVACKFARQQWSTHTHQALYCASVLPQRYSQLAHRPGIASTVPQSLKCRKSGARDGTTGAAVACPTCIDRQTQLASKDRPRGWNSNLSRNPKTPVDNRVADTTRTHVHRRHHSCAIPSPELQFLSGSQARHLTRLHIAGHEVCVCWGEAMHIQPRWSCSCVLPSFTRSQNPGRPSHHTASGATRTCRRRDWTRQCATCTVVQTAHRLTVRWRCANCTPSHSHWGTEPTTAAYSPRFRAN